MSNSDSGTLNAFGIRKLQNIALHAPTEIQQDFCSYTAGDQNVIRIIAPLHTYHNERSRLHVRDFRRPVRVDRECNAEMHGRGETI